MGAAPGGGYHGAVEPSLRQEDAGRIDEDDLGISAATIRIEAGSDSATIRSKFAQAYVALRDDIDEFDVTATPVDMMKVLAFCIVALVIGGGVGAMLAYMP